MGLVAERKNGSKLSGLTDKMIRFVLEYMATGDGKQSVINAGYPSKSAKQKAYTLLQNPKIKAVIGKYHRETREKFEIQTEEVLRQLLYLATSSGADFVDENGRLIENIHDMPERAQQSIDSFEQTDYYDEEGKIKSTKTKLKKAPKIPAIDMCLKHKGLYATEKQEHNHNIVVVDWQKMTKKPNVIDVYKTKLIEEQSDEENNPSD